MLLVIVSFIFRRYDIHANAHAYRHKHTNFLPLYLPFPPPLHFLPPLSSQGGSNTTEENLDQGPILKIQENSQIKVYDPNL